MNTERMNEYLRANPFDQWEYGWYEPSTYQCLSSWHDSEATGRWKFRKMWQKNIGSVTFTTFYTFPFQGLVTPLQFSGSTLLSAFKTSFLVIYLVDYDSIHVNCLNRAVPSIVLLIMQSVDWIFWSTSNYQRQKSKLFYLFYTFFVIIYIS